MADPLTPDALGRLLETLSTGSPNEASQALATLMNHYRRLAYAVAHDACRDAHLADDVFQETFVRMITWLRARPGTAVVSFPRLLTAFVRRTALELGRAARPPRGPEPVAQSLPLVDRIYAGELLAAFDAPARAVIERTVLGDLTSREAALELGLTAENVRLIKHRAIRTIRAQQLDDLARIGPEDQSARRS